jgi:hypothetical protein
MSTASSHNSSLIPLFTFGETGAATVHNWPFFRSNMARLSGAEKLSKDFSNLANKKRVNLARFL